jgi:hypothetical protein
MISLQIDKIPHPLQLDVVDVTGFAKYLGDHIRNIDIET